MSSEIFSYPLGFLCAYTLQLRQKQRCRTHKLYYFLTQISSFARVIQSNHSWLVRRCSFQHEFVAFLPCFDWSLPILKSWINKDSQIGQQLLPRHGHIVFISPEENSKIVQQRALRAAVGGEASLLGINQWNDEGGRRGSLQTSLRCDCGSASSGARLRETCASRHALPLRNLQNKTPLATEVKTGAKKKWPKLLCRPLLSGSGKHVSVAYFR